MSLTPSDRASDESSDTDPRQGRCRLSHPAGIADMLLYRINRLRAVGGGAVLRYCEGQFGVTRREWVLLALLAEGKPATSSELAARAALSKSATSKAVGTLTRSGLVTRVACQGDPRYAPLGLTDAGRTTYMQIRPVVEAVNQELMSTLQPCEIRALDQMLERLEAQASAMSQTLSSLPKADRRHGGAHRRAESLQPLGFPR